MNRVLCIVGSAMLLLATVGQLSSSAQTTHPAARSHAAGDAANGQALFQHTCVMCHAVQPGVKIVGPSLASVMRGPHAMPARTVENIILNGKGKMPAERDKLSDHDVADLLAYLKTL